MYNSHSNSIARNPELSSTIAFEIFKDVCQTLGLFPTKKLFKIKMKELIHLGLLFCERIEGNKKMGDYLTLILNYYFGVDQDTLHEYLISVKMNPKLFIEI